jgi:hypothetical protein
MSWTEAWKSTIHPNGLRCTSAYEPDLAVDGEPLRARVQAARARRTGRMFDVQREVRLATQAGVVARRQRDRP